MIELIGHFHPVIVHLPIGVLLVALLLQLLSRKEKYASVKPVVRIVLLWGSIAAIIACITGYFLSISDDYDRSLVNWHMWMAIGVVLVSLILYTKEVNPKVEVSKSLLSVGLLVLITLTGHFGGSLTHGSDYLTKPFYKILSIDTAESTAIKPVANVQEAIAYNDIIQPILKTRCYSCHNENKQKGKLRMDDIDRLMKGGKDGIIIDVKNVDSSRMLQRLLLPTDNEHHMPPKEKPQLSENQIKLIHWWISNKADFKKKVKELDQPEKIKPVLYALQKPVNIRKEAIDIPASAVEKADEKIIDKLRANGWLILPVSQNSNYLESSFTNNSSINKTDFKLLSQLSKQLIFLKINNASISDHAVGEMAKLSNLRRLNLANTDISDKSVSELNSIKNLQHLNLVGTKVSPQGILQLRDLKELKTLYLYQAKISDADTAKIRALFAKTDIDFGNYAVPLLQTDTMQVKPLNAK